MKKTRDSQSEPLLPAYGQLLLLTTLAKQEGLGGFGQTPGSLYPGDGDEWTASVEHVPGEDGTLEMQVVIGLRAGQFRYQDATMRHRSAGLELADALKAERAAKRQAPGLQSPRDRAAREELDRQLMEIRTRIENLRATMRELEPLLEAPQEQIWRFAGTLREFALAPR